VCRPQVRREQQEEQKPHCGTEASKVRV
jgi:hypothetical protein